MRFLLKKRLLISDNSEYTKIASAKDFARVMSILPVVIFSFMLITPVFLFGAFSRFTAKVLSVLF